MPVNIGKMIVAGDWEIPVVDDNSKDGVDGSGDENDV